MIELMTGQNLINGIGFNTLNNYNIPEFLCQTIVDLHLGNTISLQNDFWINDGTANKVEDTKGYMKLQVEDILYEYLVLEIPELFYNKSNISSFNILGNHIKQYVPEVYKETINHALTDTTIGSLFNYTGLLIFCFENDKLIQLSTVPSSKSAYCNKSNSMLEGYISEISIKSTNMTKDREDGLKAIFNSGIQISINNKYGNYYQTYNNTHEVVLFIKNNYLRLNAFEIENKEFLFLLEKPPLNVTYKANANYVNLINALLSPLDTTVSKFLFGKYLLRGIGMGIMGKQLYPIIVDDPVMHKYIQIKLCQEDEVFIKQLKELTTENIYSKHKIFTVNSDTPIVRNCRVLSNHSNTIRVLVKEDKKKLSDDEAYKNRIFRDYLSHAISLVCIPIFQKEFVIPEFIQQFFSFKMATLNTAYYKPNKSYSNPRRTDHYDDMFIDYSNNPNWVKQTVVNELPIVPGRVKDFVRELKNKTLSSSTQSRSSIFTRYFVEPYMECSINSYTHINTAAPFGWMVAFDSQIANTWIYKLPSAHLLRCSSPPQGMFYANCGLMTNKTFGLKAIMNHVFTKKEFTGVHIDCCATQPEHHVPQNKRAQYSSAMCEIFTANFVPNDVVESALKSWGAEDYSELVVPINQLLFLQEDSLNLLKSLYNCSNFTELATALDFVMPDCLETVKTLDYDPELKNHVSKMLTYFWSITTAISKELASNDTVSN